MLRALTSPLPMLRALTARRSVLAAALPWRLLEWMGEKGTSPGYGCGGTMGEKGAGGCLCSLRCACAAAGGVSDGRWSPESASAGNCCGLAGWCALRLDAVLASDAATRRAWPGAHGDASRAEERQGQH